MVAYVIAIREKTRDAGALKTYAAQAAQARVADLIVRAANGPCETLEGAAAEGVVLLEFPDMAAARTWYDGPAYREAREHRFRGGDYRFILFEGV